RTIPDRSATGWTHRSERSSAPPGLPRARPPERAAPVANSSLDFENRSYEMNRKVDKSMTAKSKLLRMDNVLIVVDDMEAAKAFFAELGMELEGETKVEGPWVGSVIGLNDVCADIAMMRTPDGHNRVELTK